MSTRRASKCAVVSGVLGLAAIQPATLAQFCASHLERTDGPTGPWIQFMGAGDFNGDGRADLVVCEIGTRIFVFFGRADGAFSPPVITETGETFRANRVKLVDLTGDGIPDLVCDQVSSSSIAVDRFRVGRADGTFTLGPSLGVSAASGAIGDLNGDGRPDLAGFRFVNGVSTAELRVIVNQGQGAFTPVTVTGVSFPQVGPVVIGDFNTDGRPDLLVLTGTSPTVTRVLLQVPAAEPGAVGTFAAQAANSSIGSGGAAVLPRLLDVTGDGIPDLVGPGGSSFFMSFNPGFPTGGFGPRVDVDLLPSPLVDLQNTLVVADVNGDNLPDLLRHVFDTTGQGPSQVLVKYNLGGGRYSGPSGVNASPPNPNSVIATRGGVAVGDFNGDGTVDIITDQTAGSDGTQFATYSLLRAVGPVPINVESGPAPVRARTGQTVTLNVQASAGDAVLSYRWLRNDQPLTAGSLGGRVSGANTPTLTIESALATDSGVYTAEIIAPCSITRASTFVDCTSLCEYRDLNGDGVTDPDDLSDYIALFFGGCS